MVGYLYWQGKLPLLFVLCDFYCAFIPACNHLMLTESPLPETCQPVRSKIRNPKCFFRWPSCHKLDPHSLHNFPGRFTKRAPYPPLPPDLLECDSLRICQGWVPCPSELQLFDEGAELLQKSLLGLVHLQEDCHVKLAYYCVAESARGFR